MKKHTWSHLISWYVLETPRDIVKGWVNVLWFNLEYFSVLFLLQTLFAPWRKTEWSSGRGFDVKAWLEAVSGNLISRILGAIIRSSLIAAGLIVELFLLLAGPAVLAAWYALPFILATAFIQGVFVASFPGTTSSILLAISFAGTGWLAYSFSKNHKKARPPTVADSLASFLKKEQKRLRFVFNRLLLDTDTIISELEKTPGQLTFADIQKKAESPEDVLKLAAKEDKAFQKVLVMQGIDPASLEEVATWLGAIRERQEERGEWWTKKNLRRRGTMGRDWTSGFSPLLDRFSYNVTEQVRALAFPALVGHEKELQAIERVLAKDTINNVLLVGEPGSGRSTIVRALAAKSALGESLEKLNYKRVMELDIPSLLSSMSTAADREAALDKIFYEVVKAGNVMLVINDFHNFVGGKERPGSIDITGVLSKYLSSPQFPIIATTSFMGLNRDIEQNPSLLSLLEQVETQEISESETLLVLQEVVPGLERKYKKFISYPALKSVVTLSSKYVQATPQPKKALDVLDEAMVHLSQIGNKVLLSEHIADIISEKTEIPIGEMEKKEKEILLNLEDLIHKRIVNQTEGVKEISSALRRARTEVGSRKGPMGSFLFLGPTGVGKTETAKALASIYFGSESRMIRLDMSEFQEVKDVNRLLGSPGQEGLLTTPARNNPFSMVLLDELEKAHTNVLNLFLQVLDEGHVTDGLGRKVDFTHTIIIATSNAGYQIILKALKGEHKDFGLIKQEIFDHLFAQGIFRPEFLNRFDGVVLFTPLTKENLFDIAGLMLKKVQRNLNTKGIEFKVTEPLKRQIAELGYNPQFGARDMGRVIQDKVENSLATALLKGTVKRGDVIEIDEETFEVKTAIDGS